MRYRALVPIFLLLVLAGCPQAGQQTEDEASPTPAESPAESPAEESPADEAAARAASLAGTWTGQWRNLTFGSSGSASATFVDQGAGTFTIEFDLGGNVFGESDPPPQSFNGDLSETSFSGSVPLLGNFTVQLNPDQNTFTFGAPDVPSARVNRVRGEGTLEGNKLTAEIEITLSDGSTANSTLELTKS